MSVALAPVLFLGLSCGESPHPVAGGEPLSSGDYAASILAQRREKETFFRTDPHSPVPPALRAGFPPLDYFPVDPSWRLNLPMIEYPDPETMVLITSTGERREIERSGRVEFVRGGVRAALQLYRERDGTGEEDSYWVPFVDAGAGRETYPAGRYLDARLQADGKVTLDFNLAYNPYCAYGLDYSCPITPRENRLSIAVRAGERGFHH